MNISKENLQNERIKLIYNDPNYNELIYEPIYLLDRLNQLNETNAKIYPLLINGFRDMFNIDSWDYDILVIRAYKKTKIVYTNPNPVDAGDEVIQLKKRKVVVPGFENEISIYVKENSTGYNKIAIVIYDRYISKYAPEIRTIHGGMTSWLKTVAKLSTVKVDEEYVDVATKYTKEEYSTDNNAYFWTFLENHWKMEPETENDLLNKLKEFFKFNAEKARMELELEINENNARLESLMRSYEDTLRKIEEMSYRLVNAGDIDNNEKIKDLYTALKENNRCKIIQISGDTLKIEVKNRLMVDEDLADTVLNSQRSVMYYMKPVGNTFWNTSRISTFWKNVFSGRLALNLFGEVTIKSNGFVMPQRKNGPTRTELPNPHWAYHCCLGGNNGPIIKAMTTGNYDEGIWMLTSCVGNVNLNEIISSKYLFRDVYENIDVKCIVDTKTNEAMTIKEAVLMLEGENKNA